MRKERNRVIFSALIVEEGPLPCLTIEVSEPKSVTILTLVIMRNSALFCLLLPVSSHKISHVPVAGVSEAPTK